MTHVRVERLGTGRAEKDVAEDHEAGTVDAAVKEEHETAHGVEGAEDVEVAADVHEAGDSEIEEPYRHDRPEELADVRRAGALHDEEDAEDDDGDGDHDALVLTDEVIEELDGAKALDGGGDGHRGREDAVGEKCGAADHGRDDESLAAVLDQGVQGEDATLVVVVRLHGHENVLDRGDEGQSPDDEGERAEDDVLAHRLESAVA